MSPARTAHRALLYSPVHPANSRSAARDIALCQYLATLRHVCSPFYLTLLSMLGEPGFTVRCNLSSGAALPFASNAKVNGSLNSAMKRRT